MTRIRRVVGRAGGPSDRGTGVVGSVAGFSVVILFLAFAVQLMLGLYTTSTVRATLHDAASRAANGGAAGPAGLDRLATAATESLGEMGERTTITLSTEDTDGDGLGDVVVGHAVTSPPRVVPRSVGGMIGFEEVRVSVRVRIEQFR